MSFTQQTSLVSMSRLGRRQKLLERTRLENGKTLLEEVSTFLDKHANGGLFTIIGHPSAGKTTEFNRLAKSMTTDAAFKDRFLPLYSELQNSELDKSEFDEDYIWKGIISGSIDVQIHGDQASENLESFCKYAKEEELTPLLLIDTLDILMLQQVTVKGINIAKLWADFLESVLANGAVLVWTCRPFEWKKFEVELDKSSSDKIDKCDLPLLEKEQLKPFTSLDVLKIEIPVDDFDSKEAWIKWSKNFQSHMPIFADRWNQSTKSNKQLDDKLFKIFAEDFVNYTSSNIHEKHWLEYAKDRLPSENLYYWLWERVSARMSTIYNTDAELVARFRNSLENTAKDTALHKNNQSSRVRLSYNQVIDDLDSIPELDPIVVHDIFNVCESKGLLSRSGPWVDFSHQLLFEEAVISKANKLELKKLKKFPSILLRTTKLEDYGNADQVLKDELLSGIGHWTGYILSYHPDCISTNSNLSALWNPWVKYSHNNIFVSVPDVIFNEHTEKRICIDKYKKTNGDTALLVNGAPGTGKTYFCMEFLADKLHKYRGTSSKLKWRYYTLNDHLAEHFDKMISDYSKIKDPFIWNLENVEGGAFSIARLIKYIMGKKIDTSKNIWPPRIKAQEGREVITWDEISEYWTQTGKVGMLTFSVFKVLLNKYFNQKSVNHAGKKIPPLADAWSSYNNIIHDPISGNRIPNLDAETFKNHSTMPSNDSSEVSLKIASELIKFHNAIASIWWTYSYAAFKSREQINKLGMEERAEYEIDLLIVDEVQDINPPVMALLLELMKPNYPKHSILVAGDVLQTVNRSGFDWIKFSISTTSALKDSLHPEKTRLTQFGVYDTKELDKNRFTLKYVWRNGKRLVEFNNNMRRDFGSSFGISKDYRELYDYPDGNLLISEESEKKDSDSRITVIESNSKEDLDILLNELKEVSHELVGNNTALLTPFVKEDDWDFTFSFPVYDADMVKGLEFDSVVILMPYMVPDDEARAFMPVNISGEAGDIQNQIQKWVDAWAENKSGATRKNFENFNQLYFNIMTRMNVLFSRSEKRLLVINPVKFGEGVQILEQSKHNQKMITFGMPPIPTGNTISYQRKGKTRATELIHDLFVETLSVKGSGSNTVNSYKLINSTLNQAGLNNDGTQPDNERKAWENLWHNIKDNSNVPLSAIAYAGGLEYDGNSDILRLLRSDISRDENFKINSRNLTDGENQFVSVITNCKFGKDSKLMISPESLYYVYSNLSKIITDVMLSCDNPRLHRFMMDRLFGVDITEINNYDFECFIIDEIDISSFEFENLSEKIITSETENGNEAYYEISPNVNNYRDTIVYHVASRLSNIDIINLKQQPDWNKRSEIHSIWSSFSTFVDRGTFDDKFVNNIRNQKLLTWMKITLNDYQETGKFSSSSYGGIRAGVGLHAKEGKSLSIEQWKRHFSEENNYRAIDYFAWKIYNDVIPKLSLKRDSYQQTDIFYLSIYDLLKLEYDVTGLGLFHEILEAEIVKLSTEGNSPEKVISLIKGPNESSLRKGWDTLATNFELLEPSWLSRQAIHTSHKFKPTKGGSVIGAMAHVAILSQIIGSTAAVEKDESKHWNWTQLLKIFYMHLNKYFDESDNGLHLNKDNYWLKYNLQDTKFRYLLSLILRKPTIDYIKNFDSFSNVSKFFSRLLMMDFVASSDEKLDGKSRLNSGVHGVGADFHNVGLDQLRESILDRCDELLNETGNQFFTTYINDLDRFLDQKDFKKLLEKTNKQQQGLGTLTIEQLKRYQPARFCNRKMWEAWEWMLYLMDEHKKSGNGSITKKWERLLSSKLRSQGLDPRYGLHKYLRLNIKEDTQRIADYLYKDYFDIEEILSRTKITAKTKKSLSRSIINWTETTVKRNNKRNFANIQRVIYSASLAQVEHYPEHYVDWEICFNMWRHLNVASGVSLTKYNFNQAIDQIIQTLLSGLVNLVLKFEEIKTTPFNFELILSYSDPSMNPFQIVSLIDSIIGANNTYVDIVGEDAGFRMSKLENTLFAKSNSAKAYRLTIAENFVKYVMQRFEEYQMHNDDDDSIRFTETSATRTNFPKSPGSKSLELPMKFYLLED